MGDLDCSLPVQKAHLAHPKGTSLEFFGQISSGYTKQESLLCKLFSACMSLKRDLLTFISLISPDPCKFLVGFMSLVSFPPSVICLVV